MSQDRPLVSVICPFRPTSDIARVNNHAITHRHYTKFFERYEDDWDWEWVDCDDPDPDTFNRGRALNEGVRKSRGGILLFADADLFVRPDRLHTALCQAFKKQCFVVPFTSVAYMPQGTTEGLICLDAELLNYDNDELHPQGTQYWKGRSTGGINVMRREVFRRCRGFDPYFKGWGFEDAGFARTCRALKIPFVYVEGQAFHYWHRSARNPNDIHFQTSLSYCQATYDHNPDSEILKIVQNFPQYGIAAGYVHRDHIQHYDDTGNTDHFQKEVYEKACTWAARLNDVSSISDLGCGSGYKTVHQLYPAFERVVGYEIEPTLSWLRNKYPSHEWRDASELSEISTDMVICSDVIEHVPDPDQFLNQLLLSEARYFVFSTPCRDALSKLRGRQENGPPLNTCHHREWNALEFGAYLNQWLGVKEAWEGNPREATVIFLAERKGK